MSFDYVLLKACYYCCKRSPISNKAIFLWKIITFMQFTDCFLGMYYLYKSGLTPWTCFGINWHIIPRNDVVLVNKYNQKEKESSWSTFCFPSRIVCQEEKETLKAMHVEFLKNSKFIWPNVKKILRQLKSIYISMI